VTAELVYILMLDFFICHSTVHLSVIAFGFRSITRVPDHTSYTCIPDKDCAWGCFWNRRLRPQTDGHMMPGMLSVLV